MHKESKGKKKKLWNENWYLSHLKRQKCVCESKSERRRGLRILRSMYYIRVKAWGFRVSFLFVRVTVKVTSNRWTLLMQISCCIYGTIRQHTGQIFECFRHADDILCHLVFSSLFLISFNFCCLYISLISFTFCCVYISLSYFPSFNISVTC